MEFSTPRHLTASLIVACVVNGEHPRPIRGTGSSCLAVVGLKGVWHMGDVDGKGEHDEDDSGVHLHPQDIIHPRSSSHARESKARQGKGREARLQSSSLPP